MNTTTAFERHRMTYLRPNPRSYGKKSSKYMPHYGIKEHAKTLKRAQA